MAKTAEELAYQRAYRLKNGNACTKKYEKSPKGFLMRAYRNMKSRVEGVQWRKAHLYEGLKLMSREEFYQWAWDNPEFWRLYKQWVQSGYARRLSPSINRIDSYKGYTLDNVEWLTHSVNSSLGGSSPKRKNSSSVPLMEVYAHVNS